MVGREVAQSRRTPRAPGAPLLVLTNVTRDRSARPRRTGRRPRSRVHAGEIVGIAGVSGNGQGALAGVIAGTMAPARGHRDARRRGAAPRRRARRSRPASAAFRKTATTKASSARCRSPRISRWRRCATSAAASSSSTRCASAPKPRSATTTCAVPARTPRSGCCPAATSRR